MFAICLLCNFCKQAGTPNKIFDFKVDMPAGNSVCVCVVAPLLLLLLIFSMRTRFFALFGACDPLWNKLLLEEYSVCRKRWVRADRSKLSKHCVCTHMKIQFQAEREISVAGVLFSVVSTCCE